MKKKQKKDVRTKYADNPLVQAFAQRLKQWRADKGVTLAEVSADIGFSTSILCEWENGRRFPSVYHLMAIATHTGIPAAEFLRRGKGTGAKKARGGKGR